MTTEAERYAQLQAIFEAARRLTSGEREAVLDARCGDDAKLRAEADELLRALEAPESDALSETGIAGGRAKLEGLLSTASDWVPKRIGSYEVERLLGHGGMGVVYEAHQESPRRRVAIKVLRPEAATPQHLQRFRQEAELLGRLRHHGIAAIHEAGSYDLGRGPQPFFAMEFVEGLDLCTHARDRQLPVGARLELLAKVCDAVHHAHGQGVIHRDLKPDNVLVDSHGQPKVLDFGIARAAEDSPLLTTLVTEEGDLLGTIAYMAPEQLDGQSHLLTARSDVYGLGAIGFELLVGRLPHDLVGLPLTSALRIARSNDPPRIGTLRAELRGDVETVIGKALEREPARRYASAADLADDLRAVVEDRPISARSPSSYYRATKFARRHKALVLGTVSTLAAVLVGLAVSLAFALRSQRNAELARAGELKARAGVLQTTQDLLELGDLTRAVTTYQRIAEGSTGWEHELLERALPTVIPERLGARRPIWATDELLLGSHDQGVVLFELDGWEVVREIGPRQPAGSILDNWVFEERIVRRFNWETGALLAEVDRGPVGSFPVLVEDQSGVLRWAQPDPSREVWTLYENGEPTLRLKTQREVLGPRFTPDGRWAVALDGLGWLGVFSTATGELHGEMEGLRTSSCNPVHMDQASNVLVFDRYNRVVRIDPERIEINRVFSAAVNSICTVGDVSDDGALFAWSDGGTVHVFDLVTDQLIHSEPTHLGALTGVQFSPSARRLLVCAPDLGSRIVDLDRRLVDPADLGTEVDPRAVSFTGHTGALSGLAISPDGRMVASLAPTDPYLRIWDAGTAEPIGLYPKPVTTDSPWPQWRGRISAFSADGERLLASIRADSEAPQLMVVELATGETRLIDAGLNPDVASHLPLLDRFLEELGPTESLRLGTAVVRTRSSSGAGPALVARPVNVPVPDGERWDSFLVGGDVRGLALSPDGAQVAVSRARRVDLFDRETTNLTAQFPGASSCIDWSPGGRLLAVGTQAGRIRLIDVDIGVELVSFRAHRAEVTCVAWTPDGSRLVSGSIDGHARVWDPRFPTERERDQQSYAARIDALRALGTPDLEDHRAAGATVEQRWASTRVAIERSAKVDDVPPGAPPAPESTGEGASLRAAATYDQHSSYVYTIAVSPDGRLAASMSVTEPDLRLWDVSTGKTLLIVPKPISDGTDGNRSQLMLFSDDGRTLLATVRSRRESPRLLVVDLLTGETRSVPHRGAIARSHLIWISHVIDLAGPVLPRRLGRMVGSTPDGVVLASRQLRGFAQPSEPAWITLRGTGHAEGVSLSPDGERVALARPESVQVLDRRDQSVLASVPGEAYALAWSPLGTRLAAGEKDGRIRLLDVDDLAEVGAFDAHSDYVFSLAWTPDGTRLISCSGDATVKVWDTVGMKERRANDLEYEAKVQLLRSLTQGELEARFEAAEDAADRGVVIRAALDRD